MIYTDEKPFVCSTCDWRFITNGSLKMHERIHTWVKQFTCSKCDKAFSQSVHLKTHETQERSSLLVSNVTSYLQWGVIWRTMKESTQEKSHLLVQSVRSDSQKVVVSKSMKGPTQERSHLPVPNVTSHSTTVDSLCFVTKNQHLQFCGLLQFSRQFPGYQFFH